MSNVFSELPLKGLGVLTLEIMLSEPVNQDRQTTV